MDYRSKIRSLFDYRLFPVLFELIGEDYDDGSDFIDQLISLQEAIYMLDDKLECNWEISDSDLEQEWGCIRKNLQVIKGDGVDVEDYLKLIKNYQSRELALRVPNQGGLNNDFIEFYYTKSCDVKLIRRLIYEKYPVLYNLVPLEAWDLFDLITEINDDIVDLKEDLPTLNGNQLLYLIYKVGKYDTKEIFTKYLKDIERKILNDKKLNIDIIDIKSICLKNICETLEQLQKNLSIFTEQELLSSNLIKRLQVAV